MPVGAVFTVVKEMSYRGDPTETWSNTYGFDGVTPPDAATWRAWFDELVAAEVTVYKPTCKVIGGYGYNGWPSKDNHAVWGVDLKASPNAPVPGTLDPALGLNMAGDQAVWLRWEVDRRSKKGKPVFLRKYYHHGAASIADPDAIESTYMDTLNALGLKLQNGTGISAGRICDPGGAAILNHAASSFTTTRTLERRGKRPLPPT